MANAVGVATSATQLSSICFSLIDLLRKIKGATHTLQIYQNQLQELHFISDSISQNPLLQTTEVKNITESLLSLINHTSLDNILRKHPLIRAFCLIYKEKNLADTFTALERQKLSLCLSIEHIQTNTLHQIQADIRTMASNNPTPAKEVPPANYNYNSQQLPPPWNQIHQQQRESDMQLVPLSAGSSGHQDRKNGPDLAEPDHSRRSDRYDNSQQSDMKVIRDCFAGSRMSQQNGPTYRGSAGLFGGVIDKTLYSNNVTVGSGNQSNGIKASFIGEKSPFGDFTQLNGTHENARAYADETEGKGANVQGTQHNGAQIEMWTTEDRMRFGTAQP